MKYKYKYISNCKDSFHIEENYYNNKYKNVYIEIFFHDNKNLIYYYLKENIY